MVDKKTEKKEKKQDKKNSSNFLSSIKKNPWIISTVLLAIIVLAVILVGNTCSVDAVSKQEAGENIVSYLNSQTGGGVTLDSVEEEGSFYKVSVSYQGNSIPVYVTKDGENFVQQPIPITGEATQENSNTQQETEELPKTDKPVVDLYVMSFCPYGNEAEDTMLPVYNVLKDKVDFNVNYIVSVSGDSVQSLHGQPEVDQNIREICVREEYGEDKFWEFITYVNENCGSKGECWEDAAQEINADTSVIQSCVDERGLDLMKEEAQKSQEAGASGSPTLIINEVKSKAVYNYGDSNSYKEVICSAFTEDSMPEECADSLESSGSNVAAGSC